MCLAFFVVFAGKIQRSASVEICETSQESGASEPAAEAAGSEKPVDEKPETDQQESETMDPPVEFETLQAVNPDIVGWIRIPGTKIDYPVVQTEDNDRYLHTGFDGKENASGSIFLDYEGRSDFKGRNTVLYGHNMKNGTMFRDLIKFKDKDYFKKHQYFAIYTPERTIYLKAIACYYDKADAIIRKTEFRDDEEFQEFVEDVLTPCQFAEAPKRTVENLYTLVTCSYEEDDARTYLFAIEAEPFEQKQYLNYKIQQNCIK